MKNSLMLQFNLKKIHIDKFLIMKIYSKLWKYENQFIL